MLLPENLRPYQDKAEKALNKGAVKDIEFSGTTYQVLIEDSSLNEEVWVFLQLDGTGAIKDAFCSASHLDSEPINCFHLAIAYLSLFQGFTEPLHKRFNRSLWNHLCQLFEERLGGDVSQIKMHSPGNYSYLSRSGKPIFKLESTDKESISYLTKIINDRTPETEETSLKFSNLSHEDLLSWREGKPTPQLRYDLSFWCDLAKWLMRKQETAVPYEISFRYSNKGLPNWIQIDFQDVNVGFYLSEANLPLIIDSLTTVNSPLKVMHEGKSEIESISYDKENQTLHINAKNKNIPSLIETVEPDEREHAIPINGWQFIPGKGFYGEESHELLKNPVLHGEDIAYVLSEHGKLISSLIVGSNVHREPIPLSYHLEFDQEWNLHVLAYLFEPGDLTEGNAWLINNWAYCNDDGFYCVENNRFHDAEYIVPIHQVSDFVMQQRAWLNLQEGFHTHIRGIEYQLKYEVTAARRLIFSRSLFNPVDETRQQDFGAWFYIEGYGFYSKSGGAFSFLLRPGLSLGAEQIPLFIRMNQDELTLIPHFFSTVCPLVEAGLKVVLTNKNKVIITPQYQLLPDYQGKRFELFDDYIYIEGEGFHEVPLNLRLPEKFRHTLEVEGEELVDFLTHEINPLSPYISFIDRELIKPKGHRLICNLIDTFPEKGKGWYRLLLSYRTEIGTIAVADLKKGINKKNPFLFTQAGLFDLREERFNWLRRLPKDRLDKEGVILNALEFIRLNAFEQIELDNEGLDPQQSSANASHLKNLTFLQTHEEIDITGLQCSLRPYQQVGLQWLWFLYQQQLSGLLCDDMGLGKTHQAMALLTTITNFYQKYSEGASHRFLIVCPTSVIYHWQEKLEKFLPELKVCSFYGSSRNLDEFNDGGHILLTSYGILRNEENLISKIPFETAIFDEIQVAKNQSSRVYAALNKVKANMKLGLTGTPIENHLRELKSLFDIILPSYMPGEAEYRDVFIKPIEKGNDIQKKTLLNRLIHPFVLRRKKENVLKDLPEKTEEVAHCYLTPCQQKLYTEVLERRRHHLLEELNDERGQIPFMHIFSLLSSLKQICDHPAVYLKAPLDYKDYDSGKWELFLELLREARESQQKVVVFSQYLNMLDIIESYLSEHHIGFASLRGSTRDRKEQLQRFKNDPSCEVFVGSLQAAGLGIDLTAASVVIHYDRWWNAARENQATDRIHRIGQTRGVQVFKLVTKGTFEEKIDAMIHRKGELMEEVVGVDDQHLLKTFTRKELIELLELVKTTPETPNS